MRILAGIEFPVGCDGVYSRSRKLLSCSERVGWRNLRKALASICLIREGMALFKVNTGTRQNEVCQLRWDWEVQLPELETTVFIIPEWLAKNGEERIVVLNEVAGAVVDRQRGRLSFPNI